MRSNDQVVMVSRLSRFRLKPLARALSSIAGLVPAIAWAQLPTGGQVVAGSAAINQPDSNHLIVQQSSGKAILNWQQFSIGEQGYVQFIQPGASAIALNRVVGADPSAILGQLSANGQVFLINPNGIVFGAGAHVDVAGIVATTMDISNADFMQGNYQFHSANTGTGATVVNRGSINTAAGGYVVLAGDYVDNEGVIQARAGTALLAAGSALTLQLSGSELVDFAVDEATVVQLAGVKNAGQILANGGRVIMTAKVANDLAATVVNNEGLVQARSTVEHNGVIYLTGEGGDVVNAGTLDASAEAGANGGNITMHASGDLVHKAGSVTTVSGAASGVSNAGTVSTWADGTNRYEKGALIEARGGAQGGDGGNVDISGKHVALQEVVDLRAPQGKLGTLSLDPNYIYISADGTNAGATGSPDAVIAEATLENQLKSGNVTQTATGSNAQIVFGTLSDGVLDGTNNGTGGSLTLLASGSGAPSISMNPSDTIHVDGALSFRVDDGVLPSGSMTLGKLQAGTSITLDAGSISSGGLTISKSINTATDTSYGITARASSGNLIVNGNVSIDVTNTTAAGVATNILLQASNGDVNVSGDVVSKAQGLGYYNYNWATTGSDAETYFGNQPWTLMSQGDHPINANLTVGAGGNIVIGGAIDVQAVDVNTAFINNGGYFQTATGTQHNFWRPTAADAAATVTAVGDVTVMGVARVIADGYANSAYSEVESYDTMVNNYNFTTGNQTVYDFVCNPTCGYNSSHNYQRTDLKGSATGNYVWSFGPYTSSLPGTAYGSPNYSTATDSNPSSQAGPMAYSGVSGITSTLTVNAGGDVVLNGIDNQAINRSVTGNGTYTDIKWATQDTAGAGNSISGSRERRYHDNFSTSYTAAPATAATAVTAGDNSSVQLNGPSYNVIAQHPGTAASGNYQANATMQVSAGVTGGASGPNADVVIAAPVTVSGASSTEVGLTVINLDGAILNPGNPGTISVTNAYSSGDARASFDGKGNVDLDSVAVNAGATANFDLTSSADILVNTASVIGQNAYLTSTSTGATALGAVTLTGVANSVLDALSGATLNLSSATISAGQQGTLLATGTDAVVVGPVLITAGDTGTFNTQSGATADLADVTINAANTAYLTVHADDQVTIDGALAANGNRVTSVDIGSDNAGVHVTDNGSVGATSTGSGYDDGLFYWHGVASLNIYGAGPVLLEGNVIATARGSAAYSITSDDLITLDGAALAKAISSEATATLLMNGAAGLQLDGDVLVQASLGQASGSLYTSGGTAAALHQDSGSTISVSGVGATLNVQAGSASALTANNAAVLDLAGSSQVSAGSGQAALNIGGASGLVNNASATSSANTAQVTMTTYDATGALTLTGTGGATANQNSANGAELTLNAAGAIDASQATLQIKNNSAAGAAGATAMLTAGTGIDTGALTAGTNGGGAVLIQAHGAGPVVASGALAATATTGTANIDLASSGDSVTIRSGGSASALAGNSQASVNISGATAVAINGDVTAHAAGPVTVTLTASSGDAVVASGVDVVATSTGTTASLSIDGATGVDFAGDATINAAQGDASAQLQSAGNIGINGVLAAGAPHGKATFALTSSAGAVSVGEGGSLSALAGTDLAALTLDGATGVSVVGALSAQSTAGTAASELISSSGDVMVANGATIAIGSVTNAASLTVDGSTGVTFNGTAQVVASANDATVQLSSDGAIGVNGALSANAAQGGAALVELSSATLLTLGSAGDLQALGAGGSATVNLTANDGLQIDGDVLAKDLSGNANVALTTLGGAAATIVQGDTSSVGAQGNSAAVAVKAGNNGPFDGTNGAAFMLDGAINAIASNGAATLSVDGAAGRMQDFTVSSSGSDAKSAISSYDPSGVLQLNGIDSVSGNTNSANGAQLTVAVAGDLDTHLASLSVANLSQSGAAGANASLAALGNSQIGDLSVISNGGGAALINASAVALTISGSVDATSASAAQIGLVADADLTVDNAANVDVSSASGVAALTLAGTGAVLSNGHLGAAASGLGDSAEITVNSTGDVAFNGSNTVTAQDGATLSAQGDHIAVGQAGSLLADGESGSGEVDLLAVNGLALAGAVNANSAAGNAVIDLLTSGGNNAAITQSAGSSVRADGASALLTVRAGSGAVLDAAQLATVALDGMLAVNATQGDAVLVIDSATGSIHDFSVTAAMGNAGALLTTYQTGGNLLLNGQGRVRGNADSDVSALLRVDAAGALDTSTATLLVQNDNAGSDASAAVELKARNGGNLIGSLDIESARDAELIGTASHGLSVADLIMNGATADAKLSAASGNVVLGVVNMTVADAANLVAIAQDGDLSQQTSTAIQVAAPTGVASIDLSASGQMALRDVNVRGINASLAATAQGGALNLLAGTTQQVNGSSTGSVQLIAAGPLNVDGDVQANSSTGAAVVGLTSGNGNTINQGAASVIGASGANATALLQAGAQHDGALALHGAVQVQASNGAAALTVLGDSGSVHDFSVTANGGAASGDIVTHGAILLDGSGAVSGNSNSATGAALNVVTGGVLNQQGAGLAVNNTHNGALAGATVALQSGGDLNNESAIAVDASGGGVAAMTLHAGGALQIDGNLQATAHNTGAGLGSAAIALTSGNHEGDAALIHQSADSKIVASSGGAAAGDASVLVQAGNCCDATAELLGATTATVDSGAGNASITVRGNEVAVQGLTAKVGANGHGDSLIDLAAPTQLTVNGVLTSQAADTTAQAGIKLITGALQYPGAPVVLSSGNGLVQLAPFNTNWVIGVESAPDFDATPTVNYSTALLQKFVGNNAKVEIGGSYDRSSWIDENGDFCVPGMGDWQNIDQQVGDIHVAGSGTSHLQLAATTMVFDTTGTTYYHDNKMSPWSVPTGRVAIYVPRPTPSLDRYVDRTDNSVQSPITGLESASIATPIWVEAAEAAPEGTVQIAGDMFMAGDGVNTNRLMVEGGAEYPPSGAGPSRSAHPSAESSDASGSSGNESSDFPGASGNGSSDASRSGTGATSTSDTDTKADQDEDRRKKKRATAQ